MANHTIPETGGDVVPVIIEQAINRVSIEVKQTTRGPTFEVKVSIYDHDIERGRQHAMDLIQTTHRELQHLYGVAKP